MRDDGANGDEVAGDGIFTLRFTVTEPAGDLRLQVSAAFQRLLRRVLSEVVSIPVGAPVADFHTLTSMEAVLDGSGSSDPDFDRIHFQWSLVTAPSRTTSKSSVNERQGERVMRPERIRWGVLIALALFLNPIPARAQFTCGSTGADGALNVPQFPDVTLDVPDSGIFNFTTVTVSGNLFFTRNSRFNPPVILLTTGDLIIDTGSVVNVSGSSGGSTAGGEGGPGGFDGGVPALAGNDPGAGHGPGAGAPGIGPLVGGNAAYGGEPLLTDEATDGVTYGSPFLIPLAGGSGGGGDDSSGGGGGGGAILLCSPTRIVMNGSVISTGGSGGTNSNGSGGAVRLLAPFVSGFGSVNVLGGSGGFGGAGRIRVDLIDRSGLNPSMFSPQESLSVSSFMAVFPSAVPRLDIVHVAGNDVPPGTPSPLVFTLPFNSPASQPITIRAVGFQGTIPIAVVVTPDSGDRIVVNTEIDTDVTNETTVNVDLPQNIAVRVHAWTR